MCVRVCLHLCPPPGRPGHPCPLSQPCAPHTAPVLRCFPEAPLSWPVGCGEPLEGRQGHRLARGSPTRPAEQSPKAATAPRAHSVAGRTVMMAGVGIQAWLRAWVESQPQSPRPLCCHRPPPCVCKYSGILWP